MRLRAALAVAALLALALPAAAGAHARLIRTTPAKGAVVAKQPGQVTFFFNEPVEASFGVIRIFDRAGNEVQQGLAFRPQGKSDALAVTLPPRLPQGTYTATYRVISSDSHPTKGGFEFSIGKPSPGGALDISKLPGQSSASRGTRYAFGIDRWLGYGAMAVAIGGLLFLVWAWRPALARREVEGDGPAAFDRRLGVLLGAAIVTGIVTSLLALPLEAASATGVSFWSAWSGGVIGDVADTRFGSLMLVRAAAWALLGVILLVAWALGRGKTRTTTSPEVIALAMLPIGSLLVSPALAGHARTQDPVALLFPADVVHVAGMCLWLGGLVMLVAAVPAVFRRIEQPASDPLLLDVVTRFSTVALAAVIAIAASGTVQAVVEVGSVPNLVETGYGRAVLVKTIVFLGLVGLGAANRQRLIPALTKAVAAAADLGRLVRSFAANVRIEVALVGLVLGVTAVLVAFVPPTDKGFAKLRPPARAAGTAPIGDTVALRYYLDPAREGRNQLNLYLIDVATGKPYRKALGVEAGVAGPGTDVPSSPLVAVTRSHWANTLLQLDRKGTWTVTVTIRTPQDVETGEFEVPVG